MAVSTLWSRVYRDRMSVRLVRSLTVGACVLQVDGLGPALSEPLRLAMVRLAMVRLRRGKSGVPMFCTVCSATHTPVALLHHRSVGR